VIQSLRLGLTVDGLASEVSVSNPPDTVLLEIAVTDTDPQRAAAIANAVGDQFATTIAAIETPNDGGSAPVKITTTQPAAVPTAPSSPRIELNLALGFLVGLAFGVGVAWLRDQFDTTLKAPEDLETLTGAAPLGIVAFNPAAKTSPLLSHDAGGNAAEAFRQLRTNLQFADVDNPPQVIVVTSPLAGDGKSTTACNIAITLGVSGARVILIEADLRRPKASAYLGLDGAAGLTNLLAGQFSLAELVTDWGRHTIDVLPSGPVPPNPSELLGSRHMAELLTTLRASYDYVIIDAPPLLPVTDAAVVTTFADGALIVVRYGKTTRDQAARAVHALQAVNGRLVGTLLNCAPRKGRSAYGEYGYGAYTSTPAAPAAAAKKSYSGRSRRTGAGPSAQIPVTKERAASR
jgi:capsular exopolysaccharide synthesis family protein